MTDSRGWKSLQVSTTLFLTPTQQSKHAFPLTGTTPLNLSEKDYRQFGVDRKTAAQALFEKKRDTRLAELLYS